MRHALCGIGLVVLTCLSGCGDAPSTSTKSETSLKKSGSDVSAVWLTDLDAAQAQATKEHKLIMADFTGSDWCGWCMKLKEEVFETAEFSTWAKSHVILLEVDFPHDKAQSPELTRQNTQMAETYKIESFPTILFLSADGKKQGSLGYVPGGPAAWIAEADALIK